MRKSGEPGSERRRREGEREGERRREENWCVPCDAVLLARVAHQFSSLRYFMNFILGLSGPIFQITP